MRIIRLQSILIFLFLSFSIYGQHTDLEIKQLMWPANDPDCELTEIPEKWKDESAVILYCSESYEFRKQVMAARVNSDYYSRQRIKILDKSAIDEYSEFSFRELERIHATRDGLFLGVKIIKPDGRVNEINTQEAVKIQKYTNSRENRSLGEGYNKLAIPDLEIGDIIDVYYVSINTIPINRTGYNNRFEFDPALIILTDKYPIVKGKLGFLTERKCYINLSANNGAPQPVKSIRDDKDYYEISYGDLDKFESELWTKPFRQYPTVKVQVIIAPKQVSLYEMEFLGQPEVPKMSVTGNEYLRLLNILSFNSDIQNGLYSLGTKFLRKQRKSNNPETLVEDLFYFYRHYMFFETRLYYGQSYPNRYYYDSFDFIQAFSRLLRNRGVGHEVFLGVSNYIGIIDSVVMLDEINPGIRVNINNKPTYIYNPGGHTVFGTHDRNLEDSRIIITKVSKNLSGPKIFHDSIPLSSCSENLQVDSIAVHFDPENEGVIYVNHHLLIKGYLKDFFFKLVLTPKDYFEDEYNHYNKIYKSKEKEMAAMDKDLKHVANKHETDSVERMDELKAWYIESHAVDDLEIKGFKLEQQGRSSANPDIVFSYEIETGDLVKNAGDYLVLEAGKLIGQNIDLSPKEKERTKDIYMPCPRQYNWSLTIDIPEGYTIDEVDDLNYSVENSTGSFFSEAVIEDGKVKLSATKSYYHNYEPLDKWPEMLEFIEAANDFVQQKIVFRREE